MNRPKKIATARFDKSMVDLLSKYFSTYSSNGVVELEITDHGIWFINPNGTRQFLGSTERFPGPSNANIH